MNPLSEKDLALLSQVAAIAPAGAALTELAAKLDRSPSALSRSLQHLHEAGWVSRNVVPTERGREVHYRANSGVDVRWVDPDVGVALSWRSPEIDWEFPLVSRVADSDSQAALVAFLKALRKSSLLDASLPAGRGASVRPVVPHFGMGVIVFGSAATGRAHRGSDVDVVVVLSDENEGDEQETIVDVGAEVSLVAPRPIQVRTRSLSDIVDGSDVLSDALRRSGIIVYDSLRTRSGAKERRLWDIVRSRME